ncbi:ATP synthase subunit delta [Arenicella chitinivorans]|uniref:ATP synthase subunit delta n=1 Tax=Arenicella chitinivorans TaxID=1329800 RepID=A0A918RWJ6_9GAMM|nr:F0F1 ATP synthase subunit delta [Arenicella chitinivorans]GHA14131.1 ATP synthase subunit delta [Arenicella chitinivorans]
MADNASIARPYAKAVFDLAQETNAFDAWGSALEQLALISQDDSFRTLIADPRVDDSQVIELLTGIAQDNLPQGGANFIHMLVQNDRLLALPDIHQQFEAHVAKARATVNADVVTAKALTNDQRSALAAALQAKLGMQVELSETVDSSLIGGAIIKAGDLVIDGSAKGRIEKLSSALMR